MSDCRLPYPHRVLPCDRYCYGKGRRDRSMECWRARCYAEWICGGNCQHWRRPSAHPLSERTARSRRDGASPSIATSCDRGRPIPFQNQVMLSPSRVPSTWMRSHRSAAHPRWTVVAGTGFKHRAIASRVDMVGALKPPCDRLSCWGLPIACKSFSTGARALRCLTRPGRPT